MATETILNKKRTCKMCGKVLQQDEEGVNGLCDVCLSTSYSSQEEDVEKLNTTERILQIISSIILIVGIIGGVACMINLDSSFIGFSVIISSLAFWAFYSCIVQIANTLRKIDDKLGKRK